MDLWTGLGILLAILALVAPVTPGFQNPWIVAAIWLAVIVYGFFLISSNLAKVASATASHPRAATFIVGAYAFLAAAGLFHTFVVPKIATAATTAAGLGASGVAATTATTLDDVKSLLAPVSNVQYRDVVAEVIHAFEPKAHITVGGAVLGPDGARIVDIQVASIRGSATPRIAAVDVIDRPDRRPVEIEAIDSAESKRRDLGVDTMLVCSDTGFSPDAISKARRTGVGLISALRQGDGRIDAVIEEEIYLRRIKVTPVQIRYDGPKVQPGVRRDSDPPIKEHDLKYRGASVDAWLESRFLRGIGGVTVNGPVTFYYRLKKPTNFDLPGRRQMRVTTISISTNVTIQWLSQVVQLDAANAIYDYVRGRVRLGPGENKYVIKGINWEKAIPIDEAPPLADLGNTGLTRGEVAVALMYLEGAPVGAKGSSDIDALIEPDDLRSDPQLMVPTRQP
jgi:hypothetical protein